jgi:signal transduction histidine kinase
MELLNNVIKHSNAENTTLSLQEVENELLIHVRDNGVGFDTNEYYYRRLRTKSNTSQNKQYGR